MLFEYTIKANDLTWDLIPIPKEGLMCSSWSLIIIINVYLPTVYFVLNMMIS